MSTTTWPGVGVGSFSIESVMQYFQQELSTSWKEREPTAQHVHSSASTIAVSWLFSWKSAAAWNWRIQSQNNRVKAEKFTFSPKNVTVKESNGNFEVTGRTIMEHKPRELDWYNWDHLSWRCRCRYLLRAWSQYIIFGQCEKLHKRKKPQWQQWRGGIHNVFVSSLLYFYHCICLKLYISLLFFDEKDSFRFLREKWRMSLLYKSLSIWGVCEICVWHII